MYKILGQLVKDDSKEVIDSQTIRAWFAQESRLIQQSIILFICECNYKHIRVPCCIPAVSSILIFLIFFNCYEIRQMLEWYWLIGSLTLEIFDHCHIGNLTALFVMEIFSLFKNKKWQWSEKLLRRGF